MDEKKILIVGAGFAGISSALDLSKRHINGLKIALISPNPHFEYHASLYRALTGKSPLEVCIPLREIFRKKHNVELIGDFITDVDFKRKKALGKSGSIYKYDYLILGFGSETNYYGIEGLKDFSFSVKSIHETLLLKKHLHGLFLENQNKKDQSIFHFVVVGGGATGVEIAGELAVYTRKLAEKHDIDPCFVTIDLISASSRLISQAPKEMSEKVRLRLGALGVNVYLNRRVMKEEIEEIYLKDIRIRAKTVIWAAGIKGNELYKKIGLPVNSNDKVIVNKNLQPFSTNAKRPTANVFVIGDGAETTYSGVAKTAIGDGKYVADSIIRKLHNQKPAKYTPEPEEYIIPVGPEWAAAEFFGTIIYGRFGWFLKRLNDLKFFLSILPFSKAITAFKEDGILWESCPVCRREILQ